MQRQLWPGLVLLTAAAVALACGGDGTGPSNGLSGRYDLVSVDGQVLPLGTTGAFGTVVYLRRGVIEFHSRGRLVDIHDMQTINLITGDTQPVISDTAAYAYRKSGSTLLVIHPAFDLAAGYTDTAAMADDSALVLKRRVVLPMTGGVVWQELLYVRAP
jgi:hypothetical protein